MTQDEIRRKLDGLIMEYCKWSNAKAMQLVTQIHRQLQLDEFSISMPMYQSARLLVARNIILKWEGVE